jgi:NAD-dependent DNA ligase
MPIYSHGNNKEYLAHIFAVLRIIEQKGLPKKCRMLTKAVVRRTEVLKNLQEAAGSRETFSTSVDVMACKVEIEQTQHMLQEVQKAHNKAIAKTYKQLRNLLSSDAQSQWDCICRGMHKRDSWAAVMVK